MYCEKYLSPGSDQDIVLRFLTHFLGNIHQPLHMTGRDRRGGNYVPVQFNGKNTSPHFAWDDLLILERINLLTNYTDPLPISPDSAVPPPDLIRNSHIKSALNESNYDPLVRWIVLEGIYGWWATALEEWTTRPQFVVNNQQQVMQLESCPLNIQSTCLFAHTIGPGLATRCYAILFGVLTSKAS
ncbi:unnamed protein product [Rhizoctonia solani]|uniref:Uncharacterized protein n=1 Tax=Rhizoctonia solani TaxID=456999 RepID=A0A8H3HC69_9AGAM|nr:unnamed protein product [Rhizoctonia solani]